MSYKHKYIISIDKGFDGEKILKALGKNGIVKADSHLWPNQYYYLTNFEESEIPHSYCMEINKVI
ncbi:hypothetical protein D3C76_180260 [compost metagenome]